MPLAITIIKDEHRALASVLKGLQFLVNEIKSGQQPPDFPLLQAMLTYIEQFPDKLHHPKEDQYLFVVLRQRNPAAAAADLDILEEEHRQGPAFIARVMAGLRDYQGDAARFGAFAQAVDDYAVYQWAHLNREEDVILPLAEKSLLPDDWTAIDAAFKSNTDPLVGVDTQREFRALFRRVVNLMPAPLGLGPERPTAQS